MKQLNDVEREYEGSSDSHMQNQQLEIAIRALIV